MKSLARNSGGPELMCSYFADAKREGSFKSINIAHITLAVHSTKVLGHCSTEEAWFSTDHRWLAGLVLISN